MHILLWPRILSTYVLTVIRMCASGGFDVPNPCGRTHRVLADVCPHIARRLSVCLPKSIRRHPPTRLCRYTANRWLQFHNSIVINILNFN